MSIYREIEGYAHSDTKIVVGNFVVNGLHPLSLRPEAYAETISPFPYEKAEQVVLLYIQNPLQGFRIYKSNLPIVPPE